MSTHRVSIQVRDDQGTVVCADEGSYTEGLGTIESDNPVVNAGKWETDDPVSRFVLREWDAQGVGNERGYRIEYALDNGQEWAERWSSMGVRPEGHECEGQHCGISVEWVEDNA